MIQLLTIEQNYPRAETNPRDDLPVTLRIQKLAALPIALLCAHAVAQQAQQAPPQSSAVQTTAQSITVTTTVEPMPFSESNRSVEVLKPASQPFLNNSVVDVLRTDPSLNLQARAADGVQADLSIRGTTFEQSLILLNGFHINDPETAHLNLDIPVPLDAVERIDVLHGSGSTFYGSDAIGGAVNLITARPSNTSLIARVAGGNYGSMESHLQANYATGSFAEQLTGERDTSDGFMFDRNYSSNAIASETWLTTRPGTTDILLATSDRPYGANQFYGPYDSWERTKGWFGGIQQQLGSRTAASFGYRRHTDLFVLFLGQPQIYENNHITTAWQSAVRRDDPLGSNTTLSYGLEASGDGIHSTNLGIHARNGGAGYANLSLRALGGFSLSIGGREEVISGGYNVFSPNVAAAYTLTRTVRLRASAGHGFRIPTFLDLYYSDPTTIGNPNLKPESSWSYEGGADWTPDSGRVRLSATFFRLQEKDTIDYSKYSLAAKWQANNVQDFNFTGAEASARIRLSDNQQLQFGYTAARAGQPPAGLISLYAFNYAAQSAQMLWTGEFRRLVTISNQLMVIQKTQQTAYPLWNLSVSHNEGRIRPYVRLLNLSNTGYEEIPGVPMQGRTIMAGAEFAWSPKH